MANRPRLSVKIIAFTGSQRNASNGTMTRPDPNPAYPLTRPPAIMITNANRFGNTNTVSNVIPN